MKITFFYIIFTIFLFPFAVSAQTAKLDTKFQSWNEIQLTMPLKSGKDSKGKSFDKVTAVFTGNLRVGRKSFDFVDNRIGASLEFRVNKYISLLAGTLYRRDEIVKNVPRYETRLNLGATFSTTWRGFTIRNRNMYEHRFRNSRADTNLYRNRTQISYPVKYKKKELFAPYISEEGYLDLSTGKWVTNEFFAGISRKINPKTAVEIAYIKSDSQPYNVSGIHFGLKIRLK